MIGAFHEWADERLDPDLLAIEAKLLTTTGSAGCFCTLDRQLGLYLLRAHPICRVSFSARRGARESCWMPPIGRVPRSHTHVAQLQGHLIFHEIHDCNRPVLLRNHRHYCETPKKNPTALSIYIVNYHE